MSRRKEKKRRPKYAAKQATTVPEGIVLLISAFVIPLSVVSFSFTPGSYNTLGLLGHTIGGFFTAIFGIGAYIFAGLIGWVGWRLTFQKPINNPIGKCLTAAIFIGSFCMLLSLIEAEWSALSRLIGQAAYPALKARGLNYHLGGAFAWFIYSDLPLFNLQHIINHVGVGLLFSSLFVASGIRLLKIDTKYLMEMVIAAKERAATWLKTRKPLPETSGAPMRLVKLNTDNYTQETMLAIEPDLTTTARPSLSRKTTSECEPFAAETSRFRPPSSPPPSPATKRERALIQQKVYNGDYSQYKLPGVNLLTDPKFVDQTSLKRDLKRQAEVLEETLHSFGIEARVGQINCGPTITSFEVHPSIGVKVQRIKALENDIALNMEAKSIRIIAPIPGKAAVGIEVPNPMPQEVSFKEMLKSYQRLAKKYDIPLLMGKAVNGESILSDLTRMPHLLIAGATGSGKSVCINTIVMSILMTARPDEVKMIMIDPKKVELTPYTALPHMLAPVITEPVGAAAALKWLVKEMENRYELFKQVGSRNLEAFNHRKIDKKLEESIGENIPERLPFIVCIIDELADLMMVSSSDIETPIARIAQMARAVGIHLILATQRPSREVITGLIKANFPTRISFKVASRINSQIVLDEIGAESLLGNGDMLFLPPGSSLLNRAQGSFIRDEDITRVVNHITEQAPPSYAVDSFDRMGPSDDLGMADEPNDALYQDAVDIVLSTHNASTTFLQRKLKIGYARAASIIDEMERRGLIGPQEGSRPRKIFAKNADPELFE